MSLKSIEKRIQAIEESMSNKIDVKFDDNYNLYINGKRLLPFNLRPYQSNIMQKVMTDGNIKYFYMYPRRSGKTFLLFYILCCICLLNRNTNAYHLFPQQDQANKVIWNGIFIANGVSYKYIKLFPSSIATLNNTSKIIKFYNGSTIRILGTSDPDNLRGITSSLIGVSEYCFTKEYLLPVITPILVQSKGRLLLESTPNGLNFAYSQFQQFSKTDTWHTEKATAETLVDEEGNRYITDEDIQSSVDNGLSKGLIQQEFYCTPVLDEDKVIFGAEMKEVRKVSNLYDSTKPIHFAFDLGVSDNTSIVGFQYNFINNGINYVWNYENNNQPYIHYIEKIKTLFNNKPIGRVILPHDGKNRQAINDNLMTAENLFNSKGLSTIALDRAYNINQTIALCKSYFGNIMIDENCITLIDSLNNYQYDDNRKPLHDSYSHIADAFKYSIISVELNLLNSGVFKPIQYGKRDKII